VNISCTCRQALAFTLLALLFSCSKQTPEPPTPKQNSGTAPNAQLDLETANRTFFQYLIKSSQNALKIGSTFEQKVNQFLTLPNQKTLESLRSHWLALEASLQDLHPLVIIGQNDAKSFDELGQHLYRIQAHPIQPGYLDRFGAYEYSGLVYDIGFQLTPESLIQQHGLTDHQEAVLGIYALEFMLFGTESNRSANDYIERNALSPKDIEQGLQSANEIPENRRRQLLSLQVTQLTKDLNRLSAMLNSSEGLASWYALTPQQQLSTVRRSLSSGLTQFLIRLAEYQEIYVTPNENDLPEDKNLIGQQRSLEQLARELRSFAPWANYFSQIEKEAIRSAIDSSLTTLNTDALKANKNPDLSKQALQTIYGNIKILI